MNPKITTLIASYEPNNKYIGSVIQELADVSDVILFTTEKHPHTVLDTLYFSKSIGKDLVYEPRKWVVDNLDRDWEYVLYNEDDIFIPANSIKQVMELYQTTPTSFIPGFIRYEYDGLEKRYIDMHPAHSVHRGGIGIVKQRWDDYNIWEPWNLHTGNWFFSKSDLINLIQNNRFETHHNQYGMRYGNCDQLESGATSLYQNYTKVYPIEFEKVECWHMPNKYVTMLDVKYGNPTVNELKQLIDASSNA
ncbi:MAG: hypothetical protein EBU90_16820 [Proteobacteria bacterium]|nr:hypothetical protein [Pseudomonadota bacterium]